MRHPSHVAFKSASLALVLTLDSRMPRSSRQSFPRPLRGVLDEVAHAATAGILLAPWLPEAPREWSAGAFVGAVLLDIDHIPGEFGRRWLARAGERPYSHTALFALGVLALGQVADVRRQRCMRGVAAGIATHLFRDLATGGWLLTWPLRRRSNRIPYWTYATVLAIAAAA